MNEVPRFVVAARKANVLSSQEVLNAVRLVDQTANAAWRSRSEPPFPTTDVCNEFVHTHTPGVAPKFTWDFAPPDGLTCMDARTQLAALATFAADAALSSDVFVRSARLQKSN
mmetsp:Transcript_3205/g.9787  ORF Transcript_3205/g.9787 Transcript_3205/m.9787 type:complete len:113 (+) Transcript_3205:1159-1497(+)